MIIAIPYFEQQTNILHSVNHDMLLAWQYTYMKSGSSLPVVLLKDSMTQVPKVWRFDTLTVVESEPDKYHHVLNKVGWLKSQAFELLGHTLIIDLDAFIISNIDYIADIKCEMAMVPDPLKDGQSINYHWLDSWPQANKKYNAGVMVLNHKGILPGFRKMWTEYQHLMPGITYYDEVIFSVLMGQFNSTALTDTENYHVGWPYDSKVEPNVLHFSGKSRKSELNDFVRQQLRLPPCWM